MILMNRTVLLAGIGSILMGLQTAASDGHLQEQAAEHEPLLFGSTYMTRNNPFFDVLHESLEEVVEENGDILLTRDPLQNQQKQNEQIMEMLDEGIQLLFLNPVDWEEVQPALEACRKAGVPVINIDTRVKDQSYVITCIETDNYQAGQECAMDMMKRLEHAKIVILDNPIQTSITDRVRGFKDALEGHDEYEVVFEAPAAGELEIGAKVIAEFLPENVAFDVLFGGNDPSALGGLSSLQKYKKDDGVLVYAVDGSPDFKMMLEMGYVTGTSSQSPRNLGRTAGETAYAYLEGEEIEKYISLPSRLITRENLDDYEINGWQ